MQVLLSAWHMPFSMHGSSVGQDVPARHTGPRLLDIPPVELLCAAALEDEDVDVADDDDVEMAMAVEVTPPLDAAAVDVSALDVDPLPTWELEVLWELEVPPLLVLLTAEGAAAPDDDENAPPTSGSQRVATQRSPSWHGDWSEHGATQKPWPLQ